MRVILILAALVGVLVGVLLLTDEKPPVAKVAEAAVLDGRSLTTATRIRWQLEGQQAIEIGRAEDGRFEMQEPIRDIASAGYLQQIVHAWDSAQMRATPYEFGEEGLAAAGLEKPEMKFVAEWDDGTRIDVAVGAPGPLGESRFLLRDEKIWEGGLALIESMRVGIDDLRERQVFRNAFRSAKEVRVDQLLPTGRREALHLKLDGTRWHLVEPVEGQADPVAAQRFVTAIVSLRADHWQPGIVNKPDREPDLRIMVRGGYGEEFLDLWLEQGQVWGTIPARNDVLFVSDNRQYSQIFVNAVDNLRARILVPLGDSAYEELVELVVDPGQGRGDRLRFVRDSQSEPWRLVEPVEYPCRATPVNEAAHALERLVAREFVGAPDDAIRPRADDPRYGLGAGRWTVTTRRLNVRETTTLWFGADAPEVDGEAMIYVARAEEPDNVAVAPKRPFDVLTRPWTDYCEKQIVRQPAIVSRVDIQRGEQTRSFALEGEEWRLVGVAGPEGARPDVGEFANDVLRDLVGREVVDMREGFGEPDWTLKLMRREGDELGLVKLWDRGPEQPLIAKGRSEQPVGFELGTRDSKDLRELWQ